MRENKVKYICTHCGSSVDSLHKKYTDELLKLTQCENCNEFADKYIEYDNVIIFIDIILLNRSAYRHLLYNSKFQNYWKLAILLLALNVYKRCQPLKYDWYTFSGLDENWVYKVYGNLVSGSIELLIYVICNYLGINFLKKSHCILLFWNALVLSNMNQFFIIPSLIWENSEQFFHELLVTLYSLISQAQALSGFKSSDTSILKTIIFSCY